MPNYEIELYELHAQKYRVQADTEAEAIQKLLADNDIEAVPDFLVYLAPCDDYGLPLQDRPDLQEALEALGIECDEAEMLPIVRDITTLTDDSSLSQGNLMTGIATKHVTSVSVRDPDTSVLTQIEIRKLATGPMVGFDAAYLEQLADDEQPCSPYNDSQTKLIIPNDEQVSPQYSEAMVLEHILEDIRQEFWQSRRKVAGRVLSANDADASLNDWVAYITAYLGRAASGVARNERDDSSEQDRQGRIESTER